MRRTRRSFLATTAASAAGLGLAAPAVAQAPGEVRWRLQSSFPKSFEVIYGGAEALARSVAEMTGGRFQIAIYPAGEIEETSAALDAAASGKVEIAHTFAASAAARNPAFALATAMPFGLDARLHAAWLREQGGLALLDAVFAGHGLVALPGGNTGADMGGWYRREVATAGDLKGLRVRASGLAADVLKRLGAVPAALPASRLRSALELDQIDAAHAFGPFDDDALGLYRAARYYYYPGWWSGGSQLHFFVNKASHDALSKADRAVLAAAADLADRHVLARYDALNATALKRLVAGGAELRAFSEPLLDACFKAATETLDAIAAANAPFKGLLQSLRRARADGYLWHQIAEHSFATYLMVQQRKRLL